MYIVGTSGHIDHGKTSIIKALTGTDCDRLPEEKKREMTIDIGFAMIEYPKFGMVSIVDVPGHERFIRNMVAGAWGIDLGLLVIAVDDGWMQQTEDHFRVLSVLGVERIIVVLNKVDLADDETIELATEEVIERLQDTRFKDADIVRVSAKSNLGIDTLKETILLNLRKLTKAPDEKKPYLFVDRIFSSKGYGTIVTGTLKNGRFSEDESVMLLPLKSEARIKKIESHYSNISEGSPSQRTALNLSGISTDDVGRGTIVVKKNFFTESDDIVVHINLIEKKKKIKNNMGIEILIGTTSLIGKLIFLGTEGQEKTQFAARIKFGEKWFFYPSESFVITHPGGYSVIGGGTVLLPLYSQVTDKKQFLKMIDDTAAYNMMDHLNLLVQTKGAVRDEDLLNQFSIGEKAFQKLLSELVTENKIIRIEGFVISLDYYNNAVEGIAKSIADRIGLNLKEIADLSRLPAEVCKIIMPAVLKEHQVVEKEGRFFSGNSITIDTLPADKKKLLSEVKEKSTEGVVLDKENDSNRKTQLKELIKLGFLVSLDGNLLYHRDIYEELKGKIMELLVSSDKITIPEAKDATALSRKYIIPLLNRIEGDGLIKRIGDIRIKA